MLNSIDRFRIDSHKLIYHVNRVSSWLKRKLIYPIYIEISPTGLCNHRCTYCGLDFMEYQNRFLNTDILKKRLQEMGSLGLKSVMYAGEGEPFLHKEIADIIIHTKRCGIDVGITTNGVLLREDLTKKILKNVEWIKVSIDGATKETYAKIHRAKPDDFVRVIENMSYAAKFRRDNKLKTILGMQLLLLPDNHLEAVPLAKLARDIGMDYLVIKPYSQHPQSKTDRYKSIKYINYDYLQDDLVKLNTNGFNVVFRNHTMQKWDRGICDYKHCLALAFWAYIDSGGNVWGCSIYLKKERFRLGNIYKDTFKEICIGQKRRKLVNWAQERLNTSKCRRNCRMDEVNRYLWELRHPPKHVNFI